MSQAHETIALLDEIPWGATIIISERQVGEEAFLGALLVDQEQRAQTPDVASLPAAGNSGPPGTQQTPLAGVHEIVSQLTFNPEADLIEGGAEEVFLGELALSQRMRSEGGKPTFSPGGSGPPGTQTTPLAGIQRIKQDLIHKPGPHF